VTGVQTCALPICTKAGSASGSGTHSGSGSGSGSAAVAPAFQEADASTVVEVDMVDFRFSGLPETVKGPKVFFKVKNSGPSHHELVVVGADGRHLGEVHELESGKSGTLAIELAPGTYTAQCLTKADDKTHVQLGLESTFKVE
jgi:uncharacterized cupredoxin-like copper-binding protein